MLKPRFVHAGGDVLEQGPGSRPRPIPLDEALRRVSDWRTAAAGNAVLGQTRLAGVYERAADDLARAADAARRWRACARLTA